LNEPLVSVVTFTFPLFFPHILPSKFSYCLHLQLKCFSNSMNSLLLSYVILRAMCAIVYFSNETMLLPFHVSI
jgi:hypothetical protein